MPIYSYKCIGCGAETDLTSFWANKPEKVNCPSCGGDAFYFPTFSCSAGGTTKQWLGRREVNFFKDDRRTIARKQTEAYVQSGKFDEYCERSKVDKIRRKRLEKGLEYIRKIAPPIKVDV